MPTAYVTERDLQMASRQTRIQSLPPEQRQEQKTWAQEKLKRMPSTCPYGFEWKRVKGGYRCGRDVCLVTDDLLAEGKGGWYDFGLGPKKILRGPFYPADTALKNSQKRQTRSRYVNGKKWIKKGPARCHRLRRWNKRCVCEFSSVETSTMPYYRGVAVQPGAAQ